jgi:hypothetical protein
MGPDFREQGFLADSMSKELGQAGGGCHIQTGVIEAVEKH